MGNRLNYTDYNFENLVLQLVDLLKTKDSWKDTYRSSTGQMFIELLAYTANLILYSIEREAEEQYLDTAQLKSSVIELVRLLNYKPRRNISARGQLQFTLTAANNMVIVPKYTECQTNTQVKVLTLSDTVISNAVLPYIVDNVDAIQGFLLNLQFYSNGQANQFYEIKYTDIENTIMDVYISGTGSTPWTQVDSFLESQANDRHFIVRPELDDTLTILFGDGIMGMVPPIDSIINIKCVRSSGLDGNIFNLGSVTTINGATTDIKGNIATLSLTNTSPFLGGDNAQDINNIKYYAPKVFSTGDRLVTRDDFLTVLRGYPSVADANVYGEKDAASPNYDMFNRIKLVILLDGWALPSPDFKNNLSTFLYSKSLMTVKYEYQIPGIILVSVDVALRVKANYSLIDVQNSATSAIEDQFVLGKTTKLGISKRISEMTSLVQNIDGVYYNHIQMRIYTMFFYVSAHSRFEATCPVLPVLRYATEIFFYSTVDGSVSIVARDDGAGNFINNIDVSTNPNLYAISGNVNYVTGFIYCFQIGGPTFPSGGTLAAYYIQDNGTLANNDISNVWDVIVGQNQICRLIYDGVYPGVHGVKGVEVVSNVYA